MIMLDCLIKLAPKDTVSYECCGRGRKQIKNDETRSSDSMSVGGRHVLGGCKHSVNFLLDLPIVLSESLPE